MKKNIFMVFLLLIIVIFIKYFLSGYIIEYELKNYNVEISYSEKKFYVEIDNKYNFEIYKSRSLSKLKITDIKEIKGENFNCIYPVIKDVTTYPLCHLNDEYIDYNLIDSPLLDKYKTKQNNYESNDTFSYNKNLNKNEYILLWNYKGFYEMNFSNQKSINIFKEDKYDNSLMYMLDNKILFPNYDQEYIFNDFYILNFLTSKYKKIETKFEISYNSYIVGNIKNKIYLYDLKNYNLYEINLNTLKVKLICSEDLGYFKYENNKKVEIKRKEYDDKKILYSNEIYNVNYIIKENTIYKIFNSNKLLKEKIFVGENIKIISQYQNNLYFISNDIFYKYNPLNGIEQVFNYFELNFNNNDVIYLYVK